MRILIFPEAATPAKLRRQVLDLQDEAWPGAPAAGLGPVHDPALTPRSVLLVDGADVLAALDILSKDVTVGEHRLRASGLSTVVTRRSAQRRGYGRRIVEHAHGVIAASGADLGIFTCDRPLAEFYRRAGWRELPGAVLIGGTPDAPFPSDQPGFDKVTMADTFTGAGRAAEEDLVGARIPLYPGNIDKLW